MTDAPGVPGPTEQHERLLTRVGDWNVACRYYMNPAEPPIEAQGTDRVQAIGKYWTTGQFRCEVMGTVIEGLATVGFDPSKQKFIGTWQDSSNPYFYGFEGEMDDDGTLTMEGDNVDPMSGRVAKYRSIEHFGDDERKLELFVEFAPDTPIKILEYQYRRA